MLYTSDVASAHALRCQMSERVTHFCNPVLACNADQTGQRFLWMNRSCVRISSPGKEQDVEHGVLPMPMKCYEQGMLEVSS